MLKLLYVIEAWLTLAWVDLRISCTVYQTWRHYFTQESACKNTETDLSSQNFQIIIACSEMAARHHWRNMNCLRRCIAQQRMLMRRKISTKLHIGVTKKQGTLAAHSWLSLQGRVINDSEDVNQRYQELQLGNWDEAASLMS